MLVLYFDFTKATVLVSLPLDLITLLAPALSGSFIPDKIEHVYHVPFSSSRQFSQVLGGQLDGEISS